MGGTGPLAGWKWCLGSPGLERLKYELLVHLAVQRGQSTVSSGIEEMLLEMFE